MIYLHNNNDFFSREINDNLFVLNDFPFTLIIFNYFRFFYVRSRQFGILNNGIMHLFGMSTKDKVFKCLDTSVTSVCNWPRKMVAK